ncbi:hypothetical protein D3C71_1677260 [compost metagenome]
MASHPLWHSPLTHLGFIATALLLGFTTLGLRLSVFNAAQNDRERWLPVALPTGILCGVVLLLVVILGYSAGFNQQGKMLASAVTVFGSGLMGWLIFGALITGSGLAAYLYQRPVLNVGVAGALMLTLLSACIGGRMLFYAGVMSQYPWF